MNPELNLQPQAMLDTAFDRLHSGDNSVNDMIAASVQRVGVAATQGAVSAGTFYQRAAAMPVGSSTLADVSSAALRGFSGPGIEIAKTVSFFVSIILIILFISIWLRTYALNKPPGPITEQLAPPEPAAGGPMTARWQEIQRHLDSVREAEWKFAVIEADKLVDDTLKRAGFVGESFGDRLERIPPGQLANIDELWQAHKLRNRVAHEVGYFLRYTEAKHAIETYGRVLQELGAVS